MVLGVVTRVALILVVVVGVAILIMLVHELAGAGDTLGPVGVKCAA